MTWVHRLRDMVLGGSVVGGICLVAGLSCPAPADSGLQEAASDARKVVIVMDSTLLIQAIAQRDSARAALAFATANRAPKQAPAPPLPVLPPSATSPDTLAWCFRLVDHHQTIALNLQRDTLRLGEVADSAIAAAQRFERASLTDSTRADSLRLALLTAADQLEAGAATLGAVRRELQRAYGTKVGVGASAQFVGETFTSVAGLAIGTRKKVWFAEVDASAIGGYGVGGNAGQTKAGLGGGGRLTVSF